MADQKLTELPQLPGDVEAADKFYVVRDDVSYQVSFDQIPITAPVWGGINGDIENQTDLILRLNAKVEQGEITGSGLTMIGPGILASSSIGSSTLAVFGLGAGLAFDGSDIVATAIPPAWGGITGTLSDQTDLQTALNAKASASALATHIADTANPHATTKTQVGLGNADNTSDANKPVSTAQQTALDLKANIASPTLTGTPAAPSAAADTNTTQIATTAYVIGQAGANNPVINGTAAPGTSKKYSREDHVHPTDTTRAAAGAVTASGITMATAKLLGRTTASTGAIEEITAGFGLLFASGIVSVNPAIPQSLKSADYTFVLADAGYDIVHDSDANPRTFTIPANASVAFPLGTVIFITNWTAGLITLAITSDTLIWGTGGSPSTGSRTLAFWSTVAIKKVSSTYWKLTGDGIT